MNWVAFLLHSTGHSIFKSTWQFTGITITFKTRRALQNFGPTLPSLFSIFEIKLPHILVSYKWKNKTPKNVDSMPGIRTGVSEYMCLLFGRCFDLYAHYLFFILVTTYFEYLYRFFTTGTLGKTFPKEPFYVAVEHRWQSSYCGYRRIAVHEPSQAISAEFPLIGNKGLCRRSSVDSSAPSILLPRF